MTSDILDKLRAFVFGPRRRNETPSYSENNRLPDASGSRYISIRPSTTQELAEGLRFQLAERLRFPTEAETEVMKQNATQQMVERNKEFEKFSALRKMVGETTEAVEIKIKLKGREVVVKLMPDDVVSLPNGRVGFNGRAIEVLGITDGKEGRKLDFD